MPLNLTKLLPAINYIQTGQNCLKSILNSVQIKIGVALFGAWKILYKPIGFRLRTTEVKNMGLFDTFHDVKRNRESQCKAFACGMNDYYVGDRIVNGTMYIQSEVPFRFIAIKDGIFEGILDSVDIDEEAFKTGLFYNYYGKRFKSDDKKVLFDEMSVMWSSLLDLISTLDDEKIKDGLSPTYFSLFKTDSWLVKVKEKEVEKPDWEAYSKERELELEKHRKAMTELYNKYIASKLGSLIPLNSEKFMSEDEAESMRKTKKEEEDGKC